MKKYQIAVLISAKLDQNKAREEFDAFKKILTNHKAQNLVELSFNQRQLAYKINKENNAYYGYVDFEIEPKNLPKIEEELRLEKAILRYLITVWEDYKVEARDKREIKETEKPGTTPEKPLIGKKEVVKTTEKEENVVKEAEVAKKSSAPKKPTKDEKEVKKDEKKAEKPKKISKKDLDKKLEELLGE